MEVLEHTLNLGHGGRKNKIRKAQVVSVSPNQLNLLCSFLAKQEYASAPGKKSVNAGQKIEKKTIQSNYKFFWDDLTAHVYSLFAARQKYSFSPLDVEEVKIIITKY